MERLALKRKDAHESLATLTAIIREPFSVIVRDATIQRFEYSFEAFWKYVKEFLKEREGLIANSPKACFKELFSLGKADEKETTGLLEMTDRRNDTSHTYKQEVAQHIYEGVPGFATLIETILSRLS